MPDISSIDLAQLMDNALVAGERAHQLMANLASVAGFYRKRAGDLTVGDEVGYGANEWKLVALVEESATAEGDGVVRVEFVDDTDHLFDPLDIVDVKAAPILEPL